MTATSIHRDDADTAFWAVFDDSRVPMALLDQELRFAAVNEAMVVLYGYPRDELLGTSGERLAAAEQTVAADEDKAALRGGRLYAERNVLHADGTVMQVHFAANAIRVGGRDLLLFVTVAARGATDGGELVGLKDPDQRDERNGRRLTPREQQILRLVALGMSTPEIAAELSLSPETIRSHVRNAMAKTETHTRAQLVATALARRLIEPADSA